MSKFVKGTSILGVMLLSFGIWQLTEMDQNENSEVNAIPNVMEKEETYETVYIEKEDQMEVDVSNKEMVDTRTVRSIQTSIENNEEAKQLIIGLGRGVREDLKKHDVNTDKEWKELEQDSEKKQEMIQELLALTDDEELKKLASTAQKKLEKTITDHSFDFYKQAVRPFEFLSEQL
ncbi:hypothetical protein [Halobacillus dabanensis]|nr:hypothetical protein [Halobacillus dabanensis]